MSWIPLLALVLAACESRPVAVAPQPANVRSAAESRHEVDPARGRTWWLTREGLRVQELSRTAQVDIPLPGWHWVDRPYACQPGIALDPLGNAIITSNVTSTVWRVDARTLAVKEHRLELDVDRDKDVGFSALAWSAAHQAFFAVSDVHGSLWRIEPGLASARRVELSTPIRGACEITTGLKAARRSTEHAGFCAQGRDGGWALHLAPDQRAAHVRPAACAPLPVS